jgi:hypothetical protein
VAQADAGARCRARAAGWSVTVAGCLAYGWWASGLAHFSPAASAAVLAPVGAVAAALALGASQRRAHRGTLRRVGCWMVLAAAALGLEAVALALGGRSRRWPSLSHLLDELTAPRPARSVAFATWLVLGALLARRSLGRPGAARWLRGRAGAR